MKLREFCSEAGWLGHKVLKGESGGFLDYRLWLVYQKNCPQIYGLFLLKSIYHRLCSLTNKLMHSGFLHIMFTNGVFSFVYVCVHQNPSNFCSPIRVCLKVWYGAAVKLGVRLLQKEQMWEKNLCEKASKTTHATSVWFGSCICIKIVALAPCLSTELCCSYASGQLWTYWSWPFWLSSDLSCHDGLSSHGTYSWLWLLSPDLLCSSCLGTARLHLWSVRAQLIAVSLSFLTVYFYRWIFISCLCLFWYYG